MSSSEKELHFFFLATIFLPISARNLEKKLLTQAAEELESKCAFVP